MRKGKARKLCSLLVALVMFATMMPLTSFAQSVTVSQTDFTDSIYTIDAGGEYLLDAGITGAINIATTEPVTIEGTGCNPFAGTGAYNGLSITGTVEGVSLTVKDLYITTGASASGYLCAANGNTCYNILNFTGADNVLTLSGVNDFEAQSNGAVIHVDPSTSLDIGGTGTLYLYKRGAWTCIGGNGSEANGTITINSGNIFAKGSQMGAVIGTGSYCPDTPGNITINGGTLNLIANARGALIGNGATDSYSATPYTSSGLVTINGGSINCNVDWTGAAVGASGNNAGPNEMGITQGELVFNGGSMRIFIDNNCYAKWGLTEAGVSSAGITADILNGSNQPLYMCAVDTSDISGTTFDVDIDDANYYEGGIHEYCYTNETLEKQSQHSITYTTENWIPGDDSNLYFYLTGTDHDISINGTDYTAEWDGNAASFTLTESQTPPPVQTAWDGTADTSWYNTTDTVFHLDAPAEMAGLAQIVNGTANGIAADNFSGKTIYLDSDIYLNDHVSTDQDSTANDWTPIAAGNYIERGSISPFNGTFDGQGHTVYNIYCYRTGVYSGGDYSERGVSLFGYTAEAAVIKNVTVTGYLYGNRYVAGIVGKVGTIVVDSYNASIGPGTIIENCVNYCTITSTGRRGSGGIVGAGWNHVTIRECVNYGAIIGTGIDGANPVIGGIAGETEGLCEDCVNYGSVTANGTTYKYNAGGIVGNPQVYFSVTRNCANFGDVSGGTAGGVTGYEAGTVNNCYSTGTVTGGTYSGGVIGQLANATYPRTNLYYLSGAASAAVGSGTLAATDVVGTFTSSDAGTLTSLVNGAGTIYVDNDFVSYSGSADYLSPLNTQYPILRFQTGNPAPAVTGIRIIVPPTKTTYYQNEYFSPEGMIVAADYSDGSTSVITEYTYSTDAMTALDTSVAISYEGATALQPVTVNAGGMILTSLTAADKSNYAYYQRIYNDGDAFNTENLVVTAEYDYGVSTAALTADQYTVSPSTLTPEVTQAAVSYTYESVTKTAYLPIQVLTIPEQAEDGYYLIDSVEDLEWLGHQVGVLENYNVNARLMQNITLSDDFLSVGAYKNPAGSISVSSSKVFTGNFDGNGKTVTFTAAATAYNMYGLFAYVSGTVHDLTLDGAINTKVVCGSVAGYLKDAGSITDCVNNSDITNTAASAGIAGSFAGTGSVTGCTNNGNITSNGQAAGISATVGSSSYKICAVSDCVNNGTIIGGTNSGGIVGSLYSVVSDCLNNGTVQGSGINAGGIVGFTRTSGVQILRCANNADVSGTYAIGGIAGTIYRITITDCYNTGDVTSTVANASNGTGGIAGSYISNSAGTVVTNCYSTGTITCATAQNGSALIGIDKKGATLTNCYYIGTNSTQAHGGTASTANDTIYYKTDAEMKLPTMTTALGSSYLSDTTSINKGYPILAWQYTEPPVQTTYTITVSDMTNGTVSASAAEAEAGDTITVTATPDEGYQLVSGNLTYNGTEITENEGVYSFTMPAEAVIIAAQFELIPVYHDVTVENTVSSAAIVSIESGSFVEGEITFTVACDEACVVFYSTDNGVTYTMLSGMATENAGIYSYVTNVNSAKDIKVVLKGDFDMDGHVGISDVGMLLTARKNALAFTGIAAMMQDIDGNGNLNILDADKILKASYGMEMVSW